MNDLGIDVHTVVDWSSFCREVSLDWGLKNRKKLGGQNVTVEIDEAKIGKRKDNKGRLVKGQWVFGGVERENTANIFVVPVESRSQDCLLKVIKENILPGSRIVSDYWKSYDCLESEGFIHLKVNHSINFVDPGTGAHTQNIERAWREVRAKIPRYGRKQKHYSGYLAEFMFKRAFPKHLQRAHEFFKSAESLYPPLHL